jgi:hypothetical protein
LPGRRPGRRPGKGRRKVEDKEGRVLPECTIIASTEPSSVVAFTRLLTLIR